MKLVPSIDITAELPGYDQSLFGLPFTKKGCDYYRAAFGSDVADYSFGFADDSGWCALIGCNSARPTMLSYFEFAVEIWVRPGLPRAQLRKLSRDILGMLHERARVMGAAEIRLREPLDLALNGVISALLLEKRIVALPSYAVLVDLAEDDDAIFAGMRSGHRQQVRAGAKQMTITYVDAAKPDQTLFNAYRDLHADVAGRVTRPAASWDHMFDLIAVGGGDLALAHWEGELVGGTLMLDAGCVSYYASGAYVRHHFDKPLAHYPLFQCVIRARTRGRTHAHLGEVIPPSLMDSAKERSINSFKLGFSSSVVPSQIWTIPVGE